MANPTRRGARPSKTRLSSESERVYVTRLDAA